MPAIIETNRLTKLYTGQVVGIEELSFSVNEGEIFGFLGSNGAGKSTTIRLLLNLIFPSSGIAHIFGLDVRKGRLEICRHIGYLPSAIKPQTYMTGEDFLTYMARLSGHTDLSKRQSLIDRFELSTKDLQRKIKHYSTGMARKVALIQAFQHQPRLVVLDEPTEGLDPIMQQAFYELINDYRHAGGTVFLSSHQLREVERVCDRAAIIRNGRLVAVESIDKLLKRSARTLIITFKFGIPADFNTIPGCQVDVHSEKTIHTRLTGPIDPVLKWLSRYEVEDLSLPDVSLHDIFLGYYTQEEPK